MAMAPFSLVAASVSGDRYDDHDLYNSLLLYYICEDRFDDPIELESEFISRPGDVAAHKVQTSGVRSMIHPYSIYRAQIAPLVALSKIR